MLGVDINIKNAESKSVWENSVKSGALRFCQANVTKNTDVEAYTLEAITLFNRLDIVVLSAGVLPTPISWMDCEVASFDRTMAINTKGGVSFSFLRILPHLFLLTVFLKFFSERNMLR